MKAFRAAPVLPYVLGGAVRNRQRSSENSGGFLDQTQEDMRLLFRTTQLAALRLKLEKKICNSIYLFSLCVDFLKKPILSIGFQRDLKSPV